MNRIELTGRLTRDPEMRATPSGVEVAQLRLAVPRRRRNGEDQGAIYVDVTAFDGQAIACGEYLAKARASRCRAGSSTRSGPPRRPTPARGTR
jgi:single-strand DNA-binding protein